MKQLVAGTISLFVVAGLAACDGGGSDPAPSPMANLSPAFTSASTASVAEGEVAAYTATATDADGDTISFVIQGGADAGQFTLDGSSGALRFASAPDFERPADANADNVYEVALSARDPNGGQSVLNLAITVTNVDDAIQVRRVGTGFTQPLFAAGLPDGTGRIVIVEKAGRARLLDPDTGQIDGVDFLDVSADISTANEAGLLGLAFSPYFATDGTVYVNLVAPGLETQIRSYRTFSGSTDQVDPATADILLRFTQPAANHNAGWLGFAQDGMLIIPTGDGGGAGDPSGFAQNPQSLLGKVLRLDVNGDDFPADPDRDYAIPSGNAYQTSIDGLPEIFALGLRNPFRASFDAVSGDLLIGDVGQDAVEEIDRLDMSTPGVNFGWNVREGTLQYTGPDQPEFTAPVAEYMHAMGRSVTGGYVYRGPVEALQNEYVFGDFISGEVWSVPIDQLVDGQTVSGAEFNVLTASFAPDIGTLGNISSFGTDTDGNLYIISIGGDVFRLEAAN